MSDQEATAHLDGFRVFPETKDGRVRVAVRLVAGGEVRPEMFEELVLFDAPADRAGGAAQDRALVIAQAMCGFMNAGGTRDDLYLLVDKFTTSVPDVTHPYEPVSVLPPPGGLAIVWARPDGTFLKVQEGDEGFVETLTQAEVETLVAEQVDDPPPHDNWS